MTVFASGAENIGWPEHEPERTAHEHADGRGTLDLLAEWLAGVQGTYPIRAFTRARLVIFAADHGLAVEGVSRHQLGHAREAAAAIVSGTAAIAGLAELSGVGIRVVEFDAGARIDRHDAASAETIEVATALGAATADAEIDAGADLLIMGGIGAGGTSTAAALISILASVEPVKTIGRGSGIDDDAWMRKTSAVRDARHRGWAHRNDPTDLLRVVGGADVAAMAGFAFQAAARRTPLLIDGVVATAAAMVAAAAQPRLTRWWRAAQLTPEPAHALALGRLGLTPVLDLGVVAADGTGGLLALPLLRAAVQLHTPEADSADV